MFKFQAIKNLKKIIIRLVTNRIPKLIREHRIYLIVQKAGMYLRGFGTRIPAALARKCA